MLNNEALAAPRVSRREVLRLGALSVFGAGLASAANAAEPVHGGPKRSCIFMMMQGGQSHHDLWDPKPDASAEIRGPFESIATATPGVRLGELMSHTARVSNHMAVLRGMTHKFTNHIAGTYVTLTGSNNQQDRDREARSEDFPGPAAILNWLEKTPPRVPRSVSLPNWLSIPGPSNRMPGQYGGFLGGVVDPFLIAGEPHKPGFTPLSLTIPDGLTPTRLSQRIGLAQQLDQAVWRSEHALSQRYDHLMRSAYDLVADGRVRQALDLSLEPAASRDRYGRTKIGQSLLLARRLVEVGVQFIGYNEFNQKWDTHGNLQARYR